VKSEITRVTVFHNEYVDPGGEDLSTAIESELLERQGIEVIRYSARNKDVTSAPFAVQMASLWRSHFNLQVYSAVRDFCRKHKPQVAHIQNFWFALSPSVHAACHDERVATVQTLRNYRLLCVNGLLMRNNGPCEDCVGKVPWRGVLHACYRDSRLSSALVARMIQYNRWRGTWNRDVDRFVALTEFARERYIAGGLPKELIAVKPNTVLDPGPAGELGQGAIFVGRLAPEKGIDVLLDAWKKLPQVRLTIVGDGPLRGEVVRAAKTMKNVVFMGPRKPEECLDLIRQSSFLVMSSRWYEGFPRVIVEAFALGRAVIAPRLGSMGHLIRERVTGLLYEPGSSTDLIRAVTVTVQDSTLLKAMSRAARAEYQSKYAPEPNTDLLIAIYEEALKHYRSTERVSQSRTSER
jgi:glycosyltransferase involved in cell wall biosynthesis